MRPQKQFTNHLPLVWYYTSILHRCFFTTVTICWKCEFLGIFPWELRRQSILYLPSLLLSSEQSKHLKIFLGYMMDLGMLASLQKVSAKCLDKCNRLSFHLCYLWLKPFRWRLLELWVWGLFCFCTCLCIYMEAFKKYEPLPAHPLIHVTSTRLTFR